MKTYLCLLLIALCKIVQAQFCATIGGPGKEAQSPDPINAIAQTTDGGWIVSSYTQSYGAGGDDMYIIKLNTGGNIDWKRTVGGAGSEYGGAVVANSDGTYLSAGEQTSYTGGAYDLYMVKMDNAGSVLWTKSIGGGGRDWCYSMVASTDGGYVMAGYTASFGAGGDDMYIVKTDASGSIVWTRTVGGAGTDWAQSITNTTDGGYAVAGWTTSYGAGGADEYVVKLDGAGVVQWATTVGYAAGLGCKDRAYGVCNSGDGGFIVGGVTSGNLTAGNDILITKLNATGAWLWTRTINPGSGFSDWGYSVAPASGGGFILAASSNSQGAGGNDGFLVKLDAAGVVLWSRSYGCADSEVPTCVIQNNDGSIATAGFGGPSGNEDVFVATANSSGTVLNCSSGGTGAVSVNRTGGSAPAVFNSTTLYYTAGTGGTSNATGATSNTGGAKTAACNFILPVELIDFRAQCENKGVVLSWSTVSEINNNNFFIERSSTGKDWEEVGVVQGAGNSSSILHYEFTDTHFLSPEKGMPDLMYFRLKQVDFNGKYEYYGPVSENISSCPKNNISILSTSFPRIFVIAGSGKADISVYNLVGQNISSSKNAELPMALDLSSLSEGIYIVQCNTPEGEVNQKVFFSK